MKKFMALALAASMAMTLTACSSGSANTTAAATTAAPAAAETTAAAAAETTAAAPADDGKVYKIIYGGSCTEDHPSTLTAYKFKELVEEKSNGRIQVDVYINNALGDSRAMLEAIAANEVQMSDAATAPFASFTEEFMFVGLPFLFNNREAAFAFFDSEMGDRINEEILKQTGIRNLGYMENGMRQLTNSKHPVTSPDDMKGLKIRVMESPMYIEMFEEMGAAPTPMSFAELYTALQQGTVDGQDNSYTITCTNGLYEVQKYMTELGHNFDVTPLELSEQFFQSLPDDLKEVVLECGKEAVAYNRQLFIDREASYIQTIEDGGVEIVKLTDEQRQAFRDCTSGCLDFFKKNYNPVIPVDEVLAAIDEANAAHPSN